MSDFESLLLFVAALLFVLGGLGFMARRVEKISRRQCDLFRIETSKRP
jgi:hypothetical protein